MNKIIKSFFAIVVWASSGEGVSEDLSSISEKRACLSWESELVSSSYPLSDIYVEKWGLSCVEGSLNYLGNIQSATVLATYYLDVYRDYGFFKLRVDRYGSKEGLEFDLSDISAIEVPETDSFAIVKVFSEASSISFQLLSFESTLFGIEQTDVLINPISFYQANNGRGSKRRVDGFYLGSNYHVYIDTLEKRQSEETACNTCLPYDVVTNEYVDGKFIEIARKPFDVGTYER